MHDPPLMPAAIRAGRARAAQAPRALLIDGLGTLVSLAPPAPALRHELDVRLGVEVSEAQATAALAAEITYYRAHMGSGRDADSLGTLRRHCAMVLREALPRSERLDRASIEEVTALLLSALRFEAYPDARPALIRARRAGLRVVVVSNWDVSLHGVVERVGLAPLLDGVVTSAAVGAAKPAPAIFQHALAMAGVAPEQAVHVGDSLNDDVRGAAACGISPLLLCRSGPVARPGSGAVPTIAGLAELDWPRGAVT
ncbi:MAG: HAD family hydrolase [Solirubrobacteraceae bacterium]